MVQRILASKGVTRLSEMAGFTVTQLGNLVGTPSPVLQDLMRRTKEHVAGVIGGVQSRPLDLLLPPSRPLRMSHLRLQVSAPAPEND